MKSIRTTHLPLAASALLLAASADLSRAQDFVAKSFDTDTQEMSGGWDAPRTYSWDPSIDAAANSASGSLMVEVDFSGGPNTSLQGNLNVASYAPYDKVRLSVYLDPATAPNASGNFGTLSVRLRGPADWAWPGTEIPLGAITNTGWTHFEKPLPANTVASSQGVNIHWNSGGFTDARTIWLDDLVFLQRSAAAPAPTMSIAEAGPGLEINTTGPGDYSRKNVGTTTDMAPNMSWLNSTGPVTYAMTVNESVEPDSSNFTANILLSAGDQAINSSPDWNQPSGIFLHATINAEGSIDVSLRYKTNAPASHGIRNTPEGLLFQATNTPLRSLVGTWSLTLKDTNIAIAGPNGFAGNAVLPPDALPYFAAPNNFWALFGAQPNARNGRAMSLSRVQISGPGDFQGSLDENFLTAASLPATLAAYEEGTGGVVLKPASTRWRVSWTLPDTGFELWSSPTLRSNDWSATGIAAVAQGLRRTAFVGPGATGAAFFQLRKAPAAPPYLLESFESAVYAGPNPPYTSIAHSSDTGVTDGAKSMKVTFDNSGSWTWFGKTDYPAEAYTAWKNRRALKFDLHRAPEDFGWNLNLAVAVNGPMGWQQSELVGWVWHNAAQTSSQTIVWDYSSIASAAPATGERFELHFMLRGNQGGGGNGYIDNIRFE